MVSCQDEGCPAEFDGLVSPLITGWYELDGETFCPSHGPMKAFERKREAAKAAKRAHHNQQVAKRTLSAAEYRAWDEFQADLANFHRETGKLAHRELRMMTPNAWVQCYRDKGRLDIAKSTEVLKLQEQARKEQMRNYLKGV